MSLPVVTLWAEGDSSRLRYVLDWLLTERLGLQYQLTEDRAEASAAAHCIAYGWLEGAISIHAGALLRESSIVPQTILHQEWQGLWAPFYAEDSPCDIQFDMLSGIFYLLSRYEEYLRFSPDKHGRYPATSSILQQAGILERPVVDEWVEALRLFLQQTWNITIPPKRFSFRPSYDIDIAWSFRFKGPMRTLGAGLTDLIRDRKRLWKRLRVLSGSEDDPYNAFIWLGSMHMQYGIEPIWFFLAALRPSRFDKNISPRHPQMAGLIRSFSDSAPTGMHPSYYTDTNPKKLMEEKAVMEAIIGRPVTISRQHYIKLRFPQTYQSLIAAGIEDDYSMGYSTHFGFRAGTGTAFAWYDLRADSRTTLRVHPFAFMDTTGHYDLGLSADQAFHRLGAMAEKLIALHSTLIAVMHNFSLGTEDEWKGWRRGYETFLRKASQL